jgi:hypothetical protein
MMYASPLARIKANVIVDPITGCWIWQGKTVSNSHGEKYGRLNVRLFDPASMKSVHTSMLVHRFVLQFIKKLNMVGKVSAHQCNNPICANPKPLKAQTQTQNMQYCLEQGRHNSQQVSV